MFKFTYRVDTVLYHNFTTEYMNTQAFQEGETLVAIVPFAGSPDSVKIVTMKRVKVEPETPVPVYSIADATGITEVTDAVN